MPGGKAAGEGYLLVQSPLTANPTASGSSEYEIHEPFAVYGRDGRWIGEYRSRRSLEPALPFPPGPYIVVTRVNGSPRQVQAEVRAGATTSVTPDDFRQGRAVDY